MKRGCEGVRGEGEYDYHNTKLYFTILRSSIIKDQASFVVLGTVFSKLSIQSAQLELSFRVVIESNMLNRC
jgi:hypothetical protein